MWNFKNRTYLVTGANSGMGKCVSELLLLSGARVFMVDRDSDSMEKMHKSNPSESEYIQFDLNKPNEVLSIFEKEVISLAKHLPIYESSSSSDILGALFILFDISLFIISFI